MAYEDTSSADDFKAIADGAKKSPKFKAMAGGDDEAAEGEGGTETADLRDAFDAEDADTFAASMLAAIKSCIANYGSVK